MQVQIFFIMNTMLKQLFYRASLTDSRLPESGSPDHDLQISLLPVDCSGLPQQPDIEQICLDHPGNTLYNFDAS
jgi:hypothetical protein